MSHTIGLATCRDFRHLDIDDRLLLPVLDARGIRAVPVVWDDPDQSTGSLDLVVLRSTWDYPPRRDAFLDWVEGVHATVGLLNPPAAVRWNTDKGYLGALASAGLPTVPTTYLHPGDEPAALPSAGDFVVKPTVSAGSRDTARYTAGRHDRTAVAHVQRLLEAGRTVMVQPYVPSVDTAGETALLFIDGEWSHAIRKGPLLAPGAAPTTDLFAQEDISPRVPTTEQRRVAGAVLAALPPATEGWLYARVDLLDTADGPVLLEVELTEPSLFLATDPKAPDRLATAIARRLS